MFRIQVTAFDMSLCHEMAEGGKARECQLTSVTPFYNGVTLPMSAQVSQAPPISAHLSTLSCWAISLYLSSSEH